MPETGSDHVRHIRQTNAQVVGRSPVLPFRELGPSYPSRRRSNPQ